MKRAILAAAIGAGGYLAYRALQPRYDFRGKHALITGGSRGLGLVLARELSRLGARLSICSRTGDQLARAQEELSRRGDEVVAVECDITNRDRVNEFVAVAHQKHGPIDVLINNAGAIQVGPIETMNQEDFEQSLLTHFWGAYYTIQEVLPEMKRRGTGRIINIASIGGKVAIPHMLPYTTGKFALVGFSEGLRAELSDTGIVVTTVCPGLMRTGSHVNARFKGKHEKEYAWFATGGSVPGASMNAERAARQILTASARGDAEIVLSLPAKLVALVHGVFPNLTIGMLSLLDRLIMPEPDGIGRSSRAGEHSRGRLPGLITTLNDRAAAANNEVSPAPASVRAGS